jgi:hypothetical protein
VDSWVRIPPPPPNKIKDIYLKRSYNLCFKKVKDNFVLFVKLGDVVACMFAYFFILSIVTFFLTIIILPFLPGKGIEVFTLGGLSIFIILVIIIPIFTLRVVSVVNAGLIKISFKLINNESVEFKDICSFKYLYSKLDDQTKKNFFSFMFFSRIINFFDSSC